MDFLAGSLGDAVESPWEDRSNAYFTPSPLDPPEVMVARLSELAGELGGLRIERGPDDGLVLRAGALRAAIVGAICADSLVLAANELSSRALLPERFVELSWPGQGRAFVRCSLEEALALLDDGQLAVGAASELLERAAF